MADLTSLTIRQFHDGLAQKKFSAAEAAEEFFDAIETGDGEIGAYLRLTKDLAWTQARDVDDRLARGEEVGMLAGVPLGIKDNVLIEGEMATAASKILSRYRASYDAHVVAKLKSARAVILGQTNMDEFAMGSSTERSAFQTTKNPHDLERVPGGSSGGSAAAVAAGFALGALGSDTGGSIRQPASFCGVVGFKPSYGVVSRSGLIAMASSLDQIGPLARTVEDAALIAHTIAGRDPLDATSTDFEYESFLRFDPERARALTVGLPQEYFVGGLDAHVRAELDLALEKFRRLGVRFKEVSLPHSQYALACYYIIMPAEVSTNLARFEGIRYSSIVGDEDSETLLDEYFENRGQGFGKEARRRVLLGTFVLSAGYYDAYYVKAQRVRRLIKEDFERVFDTARGGVDALFTPVAPTPAFRFGEKTADPLTMYLEDVFTVPANLAGLPALSVPVRKYETGSRVLPVGFQLVGPRFRDGNVLQLGRLYQRT